MAAERAPPYVLSISHIGTAGFSFGIGIVSPMLLHLEP